VEPSEDEETARSEPRTHTEIQAKLRDIGLHEGFDVWVADRGVEWNGKRLGEGCLTDLPVVASERTRAVMRGIDVIWFRKSAGHPERFFEIEHSTSVYSGLLRFNDVMIDFPIPEAFIVGEGEKTKSKFEREIARRTFEHSGLRNITLFLYYNAVRETWQKFQAIGQGSREWSNPGDASSASHAS
jgi:type II restriction enzyme